MTLITTDGNGKGTAMRILLVDDSVTMRRIQKTQMAELGVSDFVEASNGEEALEQMAKGGIDMVLLDWNMPVMDGFTALKKIRANPAWKGIKVVMCTSEAEKPRVVEAVQAGANNYIVKPFTIEILREKLGLQMIAGTVP